MSKRTCINKKGLKENMASRKSIVTGKSIKKIMNGAGTHARIKVLPSTAKFNATGLHDSF